MEITTQLQVDQVQIEDALRTYAAKWPAYGVLKERHVLQLIVWGKTDSAGFGAGNLQALRRNSRRCIALCLRVGDGAYIFPDS